jgi:hypothetical protein
MVKLYVANCSKFAQDFLFKLPEQAKINNYRAQIPMGGQSLILGRDIDRDVAIHIIEQHKKYGLVAVSEIDRTKGYFGLCYQFDKPVDVERIMQAVQHNTEQLEVKGHEQRKLQAAALANTIDGIMAGTDDKLQSLEVVIKEEPKPGNNTPRSVETISVTKPGSKAAARSAARAQQLEDES